MKSIFLCGHTGSMNRGCEAIVRSTVKVLEERNGDIFLATFAPKQDKQMAEQLGIHLIPYASYTSQIQRYFFGALRKLHKNSVCGQGVIQKPLFDKIGEDDLCLNIGGDTYCYGRPVVSLALNRHTKKKGITNVLWCCSIEKDAMQGEILQDLLQYKYIFAREALTYHNLLEAGIPKENVVKCCDPAFFMDMEEVPLPEGFVPGETVGLNISSLTVNEKNPYAYDNVMHLIRYILDNTQMSICLVPHVYSIAENHGDYPLLKKIQKEINSDRICMVEQEYNCQQLKYIISHCRFFVGSRTHATIAAYSTGVPTLVMGYSVKSRGIAIDLFGTDEGYVLPYTQCTEQMELTKNFCEIMRREADIRDRLQKILPGYKQQLTDGIEKYLKKKEQLVHICNKTVCTGCGACAQRCPASCIEMKQDSEGFYYPVIDEAKCLHCGLCQKICPIANGVKKREGEPNSFYAMNRSEDIRKASSSGGFFTAVADCVLDMGGVVFGAGFDDTFRVVHKMVEGREGLPELRGSKYVQSNIGDAFVQAQNALLQGKTVLFTGSPCQIGGLKAFLGKEYENLYTMDFICHGASSPSVWENYLQEREKTAKSKAAAVFFRNKAISWKQYSLQIQFQNGQVYSQPVGVDPYLRGFVADLFLRPCCDSCCFKGQRSQSDLTMADYWGVEKYQEIPGMEKGVSLILVRSAHGHQLLQWVSQTVDSANVNYRQAIQSNPAEQVSIKHNAFRNSFFSKLNRKPVTVLVERYCGTGLLAKMRRILVKII